MSLSQQVYQNSHEPGYVLEDYRGLETGFVINPFLKKAKK